MPSQPPPARFVLRLGLFYGAIFGLVGVYLPFFTLWLNAIGIAAEWIGLIIAAPSIARLTTLPLITHAAERRHVLRGGMIAAACLTCIGFAAVGLMRQPLAVLIAFALTACAWTPLVPLTDGYALKAVARYGLNYGPLRLWGSTAFVITALASGLAAPLFASAQLIWLIVAVALSGVVTGAALAPIDYGVARDAPRPSALALLRRPSLLTIIAAAALIQGSHAAYYTFASIAWHNAGFGGMAIALLWSVGVVGEIAVFALSAGFTLSPSALMMIGAASAVLRWIVTALNPPLPILVAIQLSHGLTFGLTQLGTMALMLRHVPHQLTASAQGYLTAGTGLATSGAAIVSGVIFARYGDAVYALSAVMAAAGGVIVALRRDLLEINENAQPHRDGDGGDTRLPS